MSKKTKISIKVAGAAGQGVESGGSGFTKVLKRCGLHVFGVSDYMSLIKGGHNFYQVTVSDEPIYAHTEKFHIVICFDPTNVAENIAHIYELHEGGIFIVDDVNLKPEYETAAQKANIHIIKMPLSSLAMEIGGSKIMANTVALGGVLRFLSLPFEVLDNVVRENFAKKSPEVAEKNSAVAKAGYDHIDTNYPNLFKFDVPKTNPNDIAQKMLINGNEAISFGAYTAGCRFISAYPMTPGTTVFEWFTKRNKELGVVTKHVEDEIASLCMAVGAGQVGARAMTTTSGGGFCLMVEALGLAAMTEVGVVVVNAMRGGPSTGLPTRTEQSDLLFAVNASHGEFPRAVFAPGTIEDCYDIGIRSTNMAARYQTPVIILTDLMLSSEIRDTNPEFFSAPEIDMGKILSKDELDNLEEQYLRFKFTEDGISPKALPGHPNAVNAPATDEHDETGHITEDPENRIKMMDKRMKKLEGMTAEMKAPELYGPSEAGFTCIVWGSTYGPVREAIDLFNAENQEKVNMLYFTDIWPMPVEKIQAALNKTRFTVSIEQNYTSQFAKLLKQEIGHEMDKHINKYNGRPFDPEELVREFSNIISNSLVTK